MTFNDGAPLPGAVHDTQLQIVKHNDKFYSWTMEIA